MNLRIIFIITLIFTLMFNGCSTSEIRKHQEESDAKTTELKAQLVGLNSRVEALEGKLSALNEKNNLTTPTPLPSPKTNLSAVHGHPSEGVGVSVSPRISSGDPESGFVNDETVKSYRKALILFNSQKYSDAVLAFSSFVEQYPDHPLAGSALFYVGDSYFKQNEYKLALQEFQRVLTSYDRSNYVADTLNRMAEAEDILKQTENAAKHRQLLTSLFPQSPAARLTAEPAAGEIKAPTSHVTPATPGQQPGKLDEPPPPTAQEVHTTTE